MTPQTNGATATIFYLVTNVNQSKYYKDKWLHMGTESVLKNDDILNIPPFCFIFNDIGYFSFYTVILY